LIFKAHYELWNAFARFATLRPLRETKNIQMVQCVQKVGDSLLTFF
jgi:hypothetical protein